MLISFLTITPAVQATGPHAVKGTLYINNEIPNDPPYDFKEITVKLIFPSNATYDETIYEFDLYNDNTNYNIGFFGHEEETANIKVEYYGQIIIPDDNQTVTINTDAGYIIDLHITAPEIDTEPPTKVTGLTVTDAKDGKLNLKWNTATDNIAIDHYNIYRDGTLLTTTTTTNYQDTGLTNGQTYCYQISATDTSGNEGEKSDQKCATPTKTTPSPGPSPGPSSTNTPPTADIGGPYQGVPNEEITLDASSSTDPDGTITSYEWDLNNDGQYDDATGVTTTYTWNTPGEYTIKLKVTDNDGATDTDTTTVTILKQNNPPTNLVVTGETNGKTNTTYTYTFTATDPDNDTMTYNIDWDDGTNTSAENLANSTTYETNHSWNTYGIYKITFTATDQDNATTTTTYTVYIDIHMINGLNGYLIDENSDGIYDLFHNNTNGNNTAVEQQTNGKYLIDDDGDGNWDYIYDPSTDTLEKYTEPKTEDNTVWYYLLAIIIIPVLLILFFLLSKRKEKEEEKSKKPKNKK